MPTDKRDIPGFARSDVFLTEAHFLTGCASPHVAAFMQTKAKKQHCRHSAAIFIY